jgi:hypothetical protein
MAVLSILEQLGMFEEITADLYPYRFVITPIAIAAFIAAGYAAYRLGVHNVLLRHRLATTLIGVPALVIALLVGDYLISPLWERSRLDEASPIAVAEAANAPGASGGSQGQQASGSSPSSGGFEAKVVQSGKFVGADDFHFGRGDAQLIQTGPNSYVLRFENFSVRNGPDLFVYLSEDASGKTINEALNLGKLKATDGAFNYEIPASVDVSKIKSAVVWCKQFAVLFTHAAFM